MRCLVDCFRVRDHRSPHLTPRSARAIAKEGTASQNRLSSLFLHEEQLASPKMAEHGAGSQATEIHKALKNEARFLKACGTIPETPIEIKEASEKLKSVSSYTDTENPKYCPWMPDITMRKLELDEEFDQPSTPGKVREDSFRQSHSWGKTSSSGLSYDRISANMFWSNSEVGKSASRGIGHEASETVEALPSTELLISSGGTQWQSKSARFEVEVDSDSSYSSVISENEARNSAKSRAPDSKNTATSPHPIPLKLSEEMQTPGTVFPPKTESLAQGEAWIRSQCVYSVPGPIAPKESDSGKNKALLNDFVKEIQNPQTETTAEGISAEKNLAMESILPARPEPKPSAISEIKCSFGPLCCNTPPFGRTGDRPIIGMVAAHWNEEAFHHPQKLWDANGIPNSTNKYKEDQKVNWHATPFEERLEKALSEEGIISRRRLPEGTPVVYDNEEERAKSVLRSSAGSKSVVSF